jgi:hypothetical protein
MAGDQGAPTRGAVADAYRLAVSVAALDGQVALGEIPLAYDALHDLERPVLVHVPAGGALHPRDERVRLWERYACTSS